MAPVDFSREVSRPGSAWFVGDNPDRTVVWLRDEHDVSTAAALFDTLARAIALDTAGLILDLSDVQFMDASIVGVIVRTRALIRPRFLVLRSPSRCARRVLELRGLAELLDPASVGPTRTTGTAGALGTWVAVRATERAGDRADASAPTPRRRAGIGPRPPRRSGEHVLIGRRSCEKRTQPDNGRSPGTLSGGGRTQATNSRPADRRGRRRARRRSGCARSAPRSPA